jgi:hypothetical protein
VADAAVMPYLETVNAALRTVSDAVVDTSNLLLSDNIHYDGESTISLGRLLASKVSSDLTKGPSA